MKKYLIGLGFILLLYASWLAQEAIVILAYIAGSFFILALLIGFFIGIWFIAEKMLMIRANRIERQKQSEVMIVDTSDGTFIRDTNDKAEWIALHLKQSVYSSDRIEKPTDKELLAWQLFNTPKAIASKTIPLLPETVSPVLPPIIDRLKASHQILISGLTGSGKTTLCKHLLTWLVSQGYSIVPCDIHSPGTVLGFDVIGSGRKFNDIFNALDVITETMHKRYNHPNYDKPDYYPKPIAVFMDELTTLVEEAKDLDFNLSKILRTLLTEGRKVNITMVLSIHSLDVETLGLKAGIRENNTMVQLFGGEGTPYECYVVPPLVSIRSKKNWKPHSLPGPFVGNLERRKFVTKMPDARTIKIRNLHAQGFSPTAIAKNIFNASNPNGRQITEIKDILGTTKQTTTILR